MAGPVFTLDELLALVAEWRREGLTIGFTCGAFDLLHAGHAAYLQHARDLCDRLIVAVNTDASIREYKNPLRPIVPEKERAALLSALRCVDAVTLMNDTRPAVLLEALKPNLYIKGGDYQVSDLKSAPLVAAYGGRPVVIPVEHETSTTATIERIQQLSVYSTPETPRVRLKGPLVLLDRDGTLIENVHCLNSPSKVKLLDGVGEGLRALQDAGFALAVITNQQGLGLGYLDYDTFVAVNSEMFRQLSAFGVRFARVYFCPHSLAEQCDCRKPDTRLIERALQDFHCPPSQCFVVGDSVTDIAAAKGAGCRGILVAGDESGASFSQAVETILAEQTMSARL
ncbi:MAG TPA: HAD-IIIA family hydrolase [Bryobacteraceae bacterium]|nr:HAD-IIIA family hydrolase [Bryobacteraceae bacterium]